MADHDLLLTCDAGTTGVKCTVFSATGDALCSVRRGYPTVYPRPGWAEQDPDAILAAACDGIHELLMQVSPVRIACLGLSGTMNGCIPVAADGRALHPNIIHSDSRTGAEVEKIGRIINPKEFYALTGNRLNTHYTLPKILWFREKMPEVYKNVCWWMNIKDYIYGHLTGKFGYTDYSDASLTCCMDIHKKQWAESLLNELNIPVARMPRILAGHDIRGRISREAARRTGLHAGTPVAIGGGDGACTARGAGLYEPGYAYCYIGSSAWVSQLTEEPMLDPQARIFNVTDMDGQFNHMIGTVQCGAAAFNWALENFFSGGSGSAAEISVVENLARSVAPGAEGVLFLPTLMGERTPYWDENTRGCLLGFTLYHNRRHVARAVYEGIAFALNSCYQIMQQLDGRQHSVTLAGGGARSGLWPNILASVFGTQTRVHSAPGECTSLGAAIAAGVGVGLFQDYAQGAKMARTRSTHEPNEAWMEKYREIYPIYARMYGQLKPLYDEIAALRQGEA